MYKYTIIIKLQQWNKLILPTSVWVCRLRWTSSCSVRLYSCYWWSGWGRSRPSGILPYVQLLRYNIESWCGHFIVCTMWIWMIKSNILIRCIIPQNFVITCTVFIIQNCLILKDELIVNSYTCTCITLLHKSKFLHLNFKSKVQNNSNS